MSSFTFNNLFNSSFTDALVIYWNHLTTFLSNIVILLHEKLSKSIPWEDLPFYIHFNEFQWKLLKYFLGILVLNLILICILWKIFGKNICERFMKPATSKAIEELKASVSKLKLPKEHTPRI